MIIAISLIVTEGSLRNNEYFHNIGNRKTSCVFALNNRENLGPSVVLKNL